MPRKPSARVVYNRANANEFRLGLADGLLAIGDAIIEEADPPDAEPYGEGLVTSGAAVVYVDGQKVGGTATKPRRETLPNPGVAMFVGWSFPGRFQELGTINHPAQPFASPALEHVLPGGVDIIRPAIAARLAGRR